MVPTRRSSLPKIQDAHQISNHPRSDSLVKGGSVCAVFQWILRGSFLGGWKLDMESNMVIFGLVRLQILEKPKNGTLFDVDWFCRNLAQVDTMKDFLSWYLMPASLYLQESKCQNFFTNHKIPLCPDVFAETGKTSERREIWSQIFFSKWVIRGYSIINAC